MKNRLGIFHALAENLHVIIFIFFATLAKLTYMTSSQQMHHVHRPLIIPLVSSLFSPYTKIPAQTGPLSGLEIVCYWRLHGRASSPHTLEMCKIMDDDEEAMLTKLG